MTRRHIPKTRKQKIKKKCEDIALVCLFAPVVVVLGPIWLFGLAASQHAQKKRERKAEKELDREAQLISWPPATSLRKASLASYFKKLSRERTSSLSNSTFGFLKLPVELRLQIYDLVCGMKENIVVEVARRDGKLGMPSQYYLTSHWRDVPRDADYQLRYSSYWYSQGCVRGTRRKNMGYKLTSPPNQAYRLGIMGMLLTCRALYNDVLNILYNNTTFQFNDLTTLHLFSRAIPSTHSNVIGSLHLNCRYIKLRSSFTTSIADFPKTYQRQFSHLPGVSILPESDGLPDAWSAACDVISKMEGLRKLRVQLCHSAFKEVLFAENPDVLVGNEDFVFEPLMGVARPEMELFEVEVDWPSGDEHWDEKDTGFEITRVGPRDRGW